MKRERFWGGWLAVEDDGAKNVQFTAEKVVLVQYAKNVVVVVVMAQLHLANENGLIA